VGKRRLGALFEDYEYCRVCTSQAFECMLDVEISELGSVLSILMKLTRKKPR
jgi:hypothetical protein